MVTNSLETPRPREVLVYLPNLIGKSEVSHCWKKAAPHAVSVRVSNDSAGGAAWKPRGALKRRTRRIPLLKGPVCESVCESQATGVLLFLQRRAR